MRSTLLSAAVAPALCAVLGPPGADGNLKDLKALGRHLAQECTPCHRLDGVQTAIPSIIGLEPDYFVRTMSFYKNGQRNNPAMVSVAESLDDRQIKALALYLGSLPEPEIPAPPSTKSDRK
jgi:cytochrome c553